MSLRLFLLAITALKVLRAFHLCVVNVQRERFSEEIVAYHVARALARSEGSPRRISAATARSADSALANFSIRLCAADVFRKDQKLWPILMWKALRGGRSVAPEAVMKDGVEQITVIHAHRPDRRVKPQSESYGVRHAAEIYVAHPSEDVAEIVEGDQPPPPRQRKAQLEIEDDQRVAAYRDQRRNSLELRGSRMPCGPASSNLKPRSVVAPPAKNRSLIGNLLSGSLITSLPSRS